MDISVNQKQAKKQRAKKLLHIFSIFVFTWTFNKVASKPAPRIHDHHPNTAVNSTITTPTGDPTNITRIDTYPDVEHSSGHIRQYQLCANVDLSPYSCSTIDQFLSATVIHFEPQRTIAVYCTCLYKCEVQAQKCNRILKISQVTKHDIETFTENTKNETSDDDGDAFELLDNILDMVSDVFISVIGLGILLNEGYKKIFSKQT